MDVQVGNSSMTLATKLSKRTSIGKEMLRVAQESNNETWAVLANKEIALWATAPLKYTVDMRLVIVRPDGHPRKINDSEIKRLLRACEAGSRETV